MSPSESEPVRETAPLPKPLLPKAPQPAPSELAMEADRPGVSEEVLPQPESETLPRILGGDAPENMAASESPPPPDNVLHEVGSLQRLSDIPIQSVPSDIAQGPDDLAAAADNRHAVPAPERGPRAADAAGGSTAALPLGAAASVAEALAAVPTVRRLADSLPMPDLLKLAMLPIAPRSPHSWGAANGRKRPWTRHWRGWPPTRNPTVAGMRVVTAGFARRKSWDTIDKRRAREPIQGSPAWPHSPSSRGPYPFGRHVSQDRPAWPGVLGGDSENRRQPGGRCTFVCACTAMELRRWR